MAIKDFRWAMSLWCCQNNATFHELLETTNRLLLNIFGGKLFLEAVPIPPLPTSCLKPLIDGYWGFEMGNVIVLQGGKISFQQMINAGQHSYSFIVRSIVARPWGPSSEYISQSNPKRLWWQLPKAESLNNQLIRKHMPMAVYALRFQRSSSKTELKPLINS